MVPNQHSKRAGSTCNIASNASHAKNPEHLALGIVTETRRGVAAPGPAAQRSHRGGQVAKSTQQKPDCQISGGVVDGIGCVGHADGLRGAGCNVDLVVPGTFLRAQNRSEHCALSAGFGACSGQ